MRSLQTIIWICMFLLPFLLLNVDSYDNDYSDSEEDSESEETHTHSPSKVQNVAGDVQVLSMESEELFTQIPRESSNLGESCTSSEQCERLVVDSECKENTCSCKPEFKRRADLWCQYTGGKMNLPTDVLHLYCENLNCDKPPCASLYTSLTELSGSSEISSPHQAVNLPCDGNAMVKLTSDTFGFGDVVTVNYLCTVYKSAEGNFTVTHIKVQKPKNMVGQQIDSECQLGNIPCPRHHTSCSDGSCPGRDGITDYFFGNKSNCKPADITLKGSGERHLAIHVSLYIFLAFILFLGSK